MKIIAEVGSNVKNLDDCFYSIEKAKLCGADAVKFQYFTSYDLYGRHVDIRPFFHLEDIPKFKLCADKIGIEFMCTMFSPEKLEKVLPYLNTIKIASSDMEYLELIDIAIDSGKDWYLSTGGHTREEIKDVLNYIGMDDKKLTLFYCESEYPTYRMNIENVFLPPFDKFPRVGVSDHSKELFTTAVLSYNCGVDVFEKHVNFCGYENTPDAPHSLSGEDFKLMVRLINDSEMKIDLVSPGEMPMRLRYNRRLIATQTILKGEYLVYGLNFGCYRALHDSVDGLSPMLYHKVNQTIADRDYKPGDVI